VWAVGQVTRSFRDGAEPGLTFRSECGKAKVVDLARSGYAGDGSVYAVPFEHLGSVSDATGHPVRSRVTSRAAQRLIQLRRRILHGRLPDVTVRVRRQGDRAVAEDLHDRPEVRALSE
jgi:hypothetical protein